MQKPLFIISVSIIALFLLEIFKPSTKETQTPDSIPKVEIINLEILNRPLSIFGSGPVRPRAKISIKAQVSGEITELSPEMVSGGRFEKDQLLILIDPRPYEASLNQAKAEELGLRAELNFAERQLKRDNSLTESGVASKRRKEETETRRDRLIAQIESAKAQIEIRKIDLERTNITAPFSGRVLMENAEIGSVVQRGEVIAEIYADDLFEITVPLSDREASLIPGLWEENFERTISAKAELIYRNSQYSWDGYVDRIEAGIDSETKTIDVIVHIPEPNQPGKIESKKEALNFYDPPPLIPGSYVKVTIEGIKIPYALIPQSALRERNSIWTVDNDSLLKFRDIEIIQDMGTHLAIKGENLRPNLKLIVSKLKIAVQGLKVDPINYKAAP